MRNDCVRAVTEAAAKGGKALSLADLRGIEGRVRQAMRDLAREDIDRWRTLTPKEQVAEAGERAAKDVLFEKAKAAANVARQIIAHDRNQGFVDTQAKAGMRRIDAVMHLLMNYLTGKGGFRTLEANVEGVLRLAKGGMEGMAQATSKYLGFWTNKAMQADIVRELHGESTGNAKARHAAKLWTDVAEGLRKQFNELGGNIRQLKGWAVPQIHSASKVARARLQGWSDFVLDRLDRSSYVKEDGTLMSDTEMRAMLGDVYNSITTDGAWDMTSSNQSSSIRNRGQDRRVLHFKDGKSWNEYHALFGELSLLESMNAHVERMGRNIGALQTFGPNAEAGFRALLDDAMRRDTAAGRPISNSAFSRLLLGKEMGAQQARALAQTGFDIATGKLGAMGDTRTAHAFQVARSWLSAARLGSASLSALTDSANGIAVARAWNLPAVAAWAKWESTAWASADFRAMMRSQGVGVEAITHAISRYGEEVFGHGLSSNLANTIFRVSGLNFVDNVRRTATGAMLFDRIGQLAREHETLAAAHPDDVARLRDAGVSDKTWQVWRQAAQEAGGDGLLTPAAIARLANRSEGVKRDAMQALIGVVSKDVDTVVPMPTLKARTSIEFQALGKRGTVGGEIARSILQFKSFPLAMISNHWQRLQSMPTPGGKALYAAQLIATSTILGAISIQLKSMVAGNNPQKMIDAGQGVKGIDGKFVARAFLQGGATGLYGDVLLGLYASPYKERLTDQMGPLAGSLADVYDIGRATLDAAKGDSKANVGGDVTRFIRGNTPGANIWWAKAAFDHLIFQRLQDAYSPGYSQRQQDRMRKYFNSTQWWPAATREQTTAQVLSSARVPDLSTATGARK